MSVDVREMPTEVGQLVEVVLRGRVESFNRDSLAFRDDPWETVLRRECSYVVSVKVMPEPGGGI